MSIKKHDRPLNFSNTFIVGLAQAIAVFPGISRSGATIATGLLQRIDRTEIARFSFLMVIAPILGKAALDVKDLLSADASVAASSQTSATALLIGFASAFVVGVIACRAMMRIVKNNKLYYFSIYCFLLGIVAILIGSGVI